VIEYSTDLFDRVSVERLQSGWSVCWWVGSRCRTATGGIELLSTGERGRSSKPGTIRLRVLKYEICRSCLRPQVEQNPDAVALIWEGEELSYAELNARANQVAHSLRDAGIGPEDVVALAVPRSVEMVVSLLGIVKSGAAYLLLIRRIRRSALPSCWRMLSLHCC